MEMDIGITYVYQKHKNSNIYYNYNLKKVKK